MCMKVFLFMQLSCKLTAKMRIATELQNLLCTFAP